MKRNLLIFFAFFISCSSQNSIENEKNIEKITTGMSYHEVINIMGQPDGVYEFADDTTRYNVYYESPLGFSDYFILFFSKKDSVVVAINDGL